MPTSSCSDPNEPNDWPVTATNASPTPIAGVVCPGDVDLYALPAGTSGVVAARLHTDAQSAGVRLALHSMPSLSAPSVTVVEEGAWGDGALSLMAPVEPSLLYFVRVDAGTAAEAASYVLEVRVEPGGCVEDPHEPNDTPAEASPIGVASVVEAVVCATDTDWWALDVPPDTHLRVAATPKQALAALSLDGEVDGEPVEAFQRAVGGVAVALQAAASKRRLLLHVAPGEAGTVVRYELRVESWAAGPPVHGEITGTVRYEDRIPSRNGYLTGPWVPAARVAVEAVRAFDEQVIASGYTDLDGAYSLDVSVQGPPQVRVRALTEVEPGAPAVSLRTGLSPDAGPIAVSSPELVLEPAGAVVDVLADAQGGGAAFNALDVAGRALAFMGEVLGVPAAPLALAWKPGSADPCGTCYYGNTGVLTLSGTAADDDAYDDAVVAHETGHHFEMAHGVADSPGGYHDGRRIDPRVAWSEGFANAFAAVVLQDSLYVDVRALGATLVLDIESVSHEQSYGTSDGTMTGAVSEDLVGAVLWDLIDAGPEPLDPASAPASTLLDTSLAWFGAAVGRGFPGVDLVDHLDGLLCLGLSPAGSVDAVAVQQRKFPYDMAPATNRAAVCD